MVLCTDMAGFITLFLLLHSSMISAYEDEPATFEMKPFHQYFMKCMSLQDLKGPPLSATNLDADRCMKILDRNLTNFEVYAWDAMETFLESDNQSLGLQAEKVMSDYLLLRMFWIAVMKESPLRGDAVVFKKRIQELHHQAKDYLQLLVRLNDTSNLLDFVELYNECPKTFNLIVDQDFYFSNYWGLVYSVEALRNLNITYAHSLKEFLNFSTVQRYFYFVNDTDNESVSIGLERHRWAYEKMVSFLVVDAEFRIYVNPPIFAFIILFGLVWNGTLLLIFARHEEVRTAPNIMVFNLALADLCNISIAPFSYMDTYPTRWPELGKLMNLARSCFMTLSALSLVALSAQRYWAVYTSFTRLGQKTQFSEGATIAYVLALWILAIILRVIVPLRFVALNHKWCDDFDIPPLMLYGYYPLIVFIPPILVLIFGVLTANLLRKSVREMPGTIRNESRDLARYRSARTLTALAVAFAITYLPYSLWAFLVALRVINLVEKKYLALSYAMYYLFFANSCINPIALYIASHTFRGPFNKYLFWCSYCKKCGANTPCGRQPNRADSRIATTKATLQTELKR